MSDRFEFKPCLYHCMTLGKLLNLSLPQFPVYKLGMVRGSALCSTMKIKCSEACKSLGIMIGTLEEQKKCRQQVFHMLQGIKGDRYVLF